jgi:hypothetical protein
MPVRDESSPQPQIDLDRLDYPSDAITIRHLRRLFPQEFLGHQAESGTPNSLDPSDNGIAFDHMLMFERELAARSFDKALGRKEKHDPITTDEELREYLEGFYTTGFQIAQGPQHARQMLRDLESAAAEQARQHSPGRP